MEKCIHSFTRVIHYIKRTNSGRLKKVKTFQCVKCGHSSIYLIAKCRLEWHQIGVANERI